MTAIVGVLCSDGVVIGTDSSATFTQGQIRTIEQPTKKIDIVTNKLIIAGTGQIGLGQRFSGIVKEMSEKGQMGRDYLEVGRKISEFTRKNFASTGVEKGQYGALLAYAAGANFYLCEFSPENFQPEWKTKDIWYVSMGCGQTITDPFLGFMRRVFWGDEIPTVADATFAATWTLQQAISLNTGGINGPIQLATIKNDETQREFKAQMLTNADLHEHNNNVIEAEKYLSRYKEILMGKNGIEIPKV